MPWTRIDSTSAWPQVELAHRAQIQSDRQAEQVLNRRSPRMVALFTRLFRHAFLRDFHALRISLSGPPPDATTPRLVVYSNHPSWWDAVAFLLLADILFPRRAGYAPVDARMLRSYGFLARIGAFGIDIDDRSAGRAFLSASGQILRRPEGLLLVTAQGRFADVRERPIQLKPGLAHLAEWQPDATFVPLALDYVFWDERTPELLVRFGPAVPARALCVRPVHKRSAALAQALEETMDALAAEAVARNTDAFRTLLTGSVGVGGVYDLWRRGRAFLRGERFSPAHGGQP